MKANKETPQRPAIYPEVKSYVCSGDGAITVEQAKELLGWEEETEQVKFATDYLLTDQEDKKIRCTNNVKNRPLYANILQALMQEHLMKRWRLNGEPIIIGRTGLILNGQHTLIALVLAEQIRTSEKQKHHWKEYWSGPVTMEKLIVYGIDESDSTVNTMDTCKPRTLADVVYRSGYFAGMKDSDRRVVSRMCDYTIRILWHRTGAGVDAFAPRRTHSEALDFIARHPHILASVKHIFQENSDKAISKYLSPGYASGLLYLMGCSAGDPDEYRNADPPSEKKLNWDYWEKACEFWVLLNSGTEMQEVRIALGKLVDADHLGGGPLALKAGVLIKAWQHFLLNHKITQKDLELSYYTDVDEIKHYENPTLNGIDLGNPKDKEHSSNLTVEEVEKAKAEERRRKAPELDAVLRARQGIVTDNGQPSATVAEAGKGKPPAPKLRKDTSEESSKLKKAPPKPKRKN